MVRSPREFQVAPGGTFQLADVSLLATDLSLEAARAHLACGIGLDREAAIPRRPATPTADDPERAGRLRLVAQG